MDGVLNVGDIVVLKGTSYEDVNAQEVVLDSPVYFSVEPNDPLKETQTLVFPDGQSVPVEEKGDTIVYVSRVTGGQIIHRVIAKVSTPQGNYFLTKGDANTVPDAARVTCGEFAPNGSCLNVIVDGVCTPEDARDPSSYCLSTPVSEKDVIGKQVLMVPVLGHVKMAVFHIVGLPLGVPGYPAEFWCSNWIPGFFDPWSKHWS
jgi:signal peptidase I